MVCGNKILSLVYIFLFRWRAHGSCVDASSSHIIDIIYLCPAFCSRFLKKDDVSVWNVCAVHRTQGLDSKCSEQSRSLNYFLLNIWNKPVIIRRCVKRWDEYLQ